MHHFDDSMQWILHSSDTDELRKRIEVAISKQEILKSSDQYALFQSTDIYTHFLFFIFYNYTLLISVLCYAFNFQSFYYTCLKSNIVIVKTCMSHLDTHECLHQTKGGATDEP